MQNFSNILIFHPAAIGDAVLATPVASTLKANFPGAKITYWSHNSLRPLLLGLCPHVDDFIDFDKGMGYFELRKILNDARPDLFVDLSNSSRGKLLPLFSRTAVARYEKKADTGPGQQHAVGNFLEAIAPFCPDLPKDVFPTLFPDAIAEELVPQLVAGNKLSLRPLIGIVPGVGAFRPHRAWIPDGWTYLIRHIMQMDTHIPVLIGGSDDFETAQRIAAEFGDKVLNLCGQLKLDETAAILKCCDVVLSGDTGPAHIAVAVGTPVIGLYGPTYPARSGPYGYFNLVIDQSSSCQCIGERFCKIGNPNNPGECMNRIMLTEVIGRLHEVLGSLEQELPEEAGVLVDPAVLAELEQFKRTDSQS